MSEKLIFIYDGDCPFCNKFAELLELKSGLPNIELKDARSNPTELPFNYDMDVKGAILIKGNQVLYGANAINMICAKIKNPSDALLRLLSITFNSNKRANLLFPFLLIARRMTLFLKGVPRKISFEG